MISQQIRLIAAMLFLVPFMVAHAQWSSDHASNNPICRAGNTQRAPRSVSDGKGGAIICWDDERTMQGLFNIYAQRIDKDGVVRWTVNGIAINAAFPVASKPEMVSDDAGGAIIVWTDVTNGDKDIYAQRIDSSGRVLWATYGVPIATGTIFQMQPKITTDGNHGAIITWIAHTGIQDDHVYAQRVDGSGNLVWGQEVAISTATQFQSTPSICSDGSGGAYIAWGVYTGLYDVYAQRVDANGGTAWQTDGVGIAIGAPAEDSPKLVPDGTGKAFMSYIDFGAGANPVVQIAVVNRDGSTAASMRVTSTSGGQRNPQMSNIGPGLLGVVWEDGRVSGKTRSFAQIIDNTGKKLWAANGVEVSNRTGNQATPFCISDGNSGMIVSWEDMTKSVTESDIYAQRFSAAGAPLWTSAGVPLCSAVKMQQWPWMISDDRNGAIVTWEDFRPSFSNPEIYASRIQADGTLPIGPPVLTFSSKTVAFGTVSVGSPSTKTITLTNTGGTPLTIASVTPSDPHFTLTPESNTIAPNGNIDATVRFQPTSKNPLSAYIVVESNSFLSPDTIVVTGSGTATAGIQLDKMSLNFTSVTIGLSKALTLNISNPGNDTLTISSITSSDPSFTVAITSRVLAPGAAFNDTVRFTPTAPGPVSAELTLTSNAPSSPTILPLAGSGTVEVMVTLAIDPTYIFLGEVVVDSLKDTTLTVTNTGNDTLRISSFTSGDSHFTLETPLSTIAPTGVKTFTIRFKPTAVGSLSTFFIVTSNARTSPDTIGVQGIGKEIVAVRSLQVSPGAFTLFQNYPNPFHPSTAIRYDLEASATVRLSVHNSLGQVVATLVDETQRPGVHTVQWTSQGSAPGVYFYVLRVGAIAAYGRMVLTQ